MPAAEEMSASPTLNQTAARTMRAVVHPRYGEPDVLELQAVERPTPKDEEVLVRVQAAGVSIGDHHVVTGKPYLIRLSPFGGLPTPKNRVPGMALAGTVETVGARVSALQPGDTVFGEAPNGAFAEYAAVLAQKLVSKPSNASFEEAAAIPWGCTALQGLRDAGSLVAGQRVLINGASGAVGTWAVQIARAWGAEVTAVCSTRNVEWVRALGAHTVIDYTRDKFVEGGARFDLILDMVGNHTLSECRRVLTPTGTYVACSGQGGDWVGPVFRLAGVHLTSLFTRQKLTSFFGAANQKDLLVLKALVEEGKARPVIEQCYPLAGIAGALRHVGEGHTRGQTVVRVGA